LARAALLVAALALVVAAIAFSSPELRRRARPSLERLGLLRPYQESAQYAEIVERHRRENEALDARCVVLLGDSLTEGFPAQLAAPRRWSVRGISGDRVRHVAARLESSALGAPCPAVAVLVGSNDVVIDGGPPAEAAAQIESLAEALRAAGKQVVVATVPPVRGRFAASNGAIRALDDRIRALGARGFAVADLHAALADPAGELAAAYTRDGLHLTPAAYERWAAVLDEALR
jgi:lysophospholipase L1-like esterase